jgi:nitrogen regulatory protein PII
MKPCKRIEIVIETAMVETLTGLLQKLGAPGYTLLQDAKGAGDRGVRRADQLSGDSSNSVLLIACDDAKIVQDIVEGVRPLLVRSGGICLVSDAQWLRH